MIEQVAGGVAGFLLAAWPGYRYGILCRRLPVSRYRIANVAGLAAGGVLAFAGAVAGYQWLWVAGIGVMAGSLTGLKYGLGRSVGALRPAEKDPGSGGGAG